VSPRYRHRKSRPLHNFRYGWFHFDQHRQGIRHTHSRRRDRTTESPRRSGFRGVPRTVLFRELRWQFLRGLLVAIVLLVIWALGFGIWDIMRAKSDIASAKSAATQIIDGRDSLLTAPGRATAAVQLHTMHSSAYSADLRLKGSAPLTVLSWIPFVNRQVNGLRDAVSDVDETAAQGQRLLASASAAADASHGTYVDLPTLKRLNEQVHASRLALQGRVRSAAGLVGPIKAARLSINRQLRVLNGLLKNADSALTFAQPFLGSTGPRTYFVAGLNNSEMRDQGMVLSWAILHVNAGHFEMSRSATVGTISLRKPAVALTDKGTKTVFGPLEPTRIWQSVNAVGDFRTSSRWMIAMYAAARGEQVDGVLGIDAVTLQNILRVTGSVRIPNTKPAINASNVASLILHDLYVKYPAGSQQQGRRDEISAIAQAAVTKMKRGGFDSALLIKALAKSTGGRHLLFYDTNATNEANIIKFGASGALVGRSENVIHTSIQSGVAAKLDWFMRETLQYDIRVNSEGTAFITTTIALKNTAPPHPKPSYAFGPDNTNTHTAGEYIARIYQWLPSNAESPAAVKQDGLTLARTVVHIPAHQANVAVLQAVIKNAVKDGALSFTFIPQGTIRPIPVTVTLHSDVSLNGPGTISWSGEKTKTVTWSANR
jgi:hypothetical protein